jgi:enoyl-CoA hydratase
MTTAVRTEDHGHVRELVLCRADEFNTITVELRDELGEALDAADRDRDVRVVLIRAEGRAFCAGFGLDWSTEPRRPMRSGPPQDLGANGLASEGLRGEQGQAAADAQGPAWDSVADLAMISTFARTWARLHEISKPTLAAVQGWCIAGGTDMILNADLIVAARSARFGYPPARVWGTPEAPWVWVARLGLERAKRYLFTGDEIDGEEAARIGLVLECVDDDALLDHARALAGRMAQLPLNQLQMHKLLCNNVARHLYDPDTSRLLGCLFDGVARHTQEGLDFVSRSQEVGWRQAIRERDQPFGDYGERPR